MRRISLKKIVCLSITILFVLTNFAYAKSVTKDESVFVTLNSSGIVKQQIVSDWIHADSQIKGLEDISTLKNIINIKGNEIPKINGSKLKWDMSSNDIFYQGDTDKKLPISIRVKYYFNGKIIEPNKLIGKSGKVKLRIDITNNTFESVKINNKNKRVATQFTSVVLLNLPIQNFKNIKTSTGAVVSDGNNQIVAFVAFPGLKETLNVKQDLIDIPEGITIEAITNNFSLGSIMAVATPQLPAIKEFNEAKTINDLKNGINKLSDAGKKLEEGSVKLSDGQKTFVSKFIELCSGLSALNTGIETIKLNQKKIVNGAMQLKSGVKSLGNGIVSLSNGAMQIGNGSKQLGDGAFLLADNTIKVVDGVIKLGDGAKTIGDKTRELSEGMVKISDSTIKLKQGEQSLLEGINILYTGVAQLKMSKQKENEALDKLIPGMDELKKLAAAISQIPNTKELTDKLIVGIDNETNGLKQLRSAGDKVLAGINQIEIGMKNTKDGTEKLNQGLIQLNNAQNTAKDGAVMLSLGTLTITPALEQLKNGANAIANGAKKIQQSGIKLSDSALKFAEGGSKLAAGSKKLEAGIEALSSGCTKLYSGIDTVSSGIEKAYNGAIKLNSGAKTLSKANAALAENIGKLNSQGLTKMSNKVNSTIDKVEDLLKIKDKILALSKAYKDYSGIAPNMDGKVKFIFKLDELKQTAKK